jgi:hypothetical protein
MSLLGRVLAYQARYDMESQRWNRSAVNNFMTKKSSALQFSLIILSSGDAVRSHR